MLTLGVETSCDETAAAVVENGTNILSNVVSSQIELHAPFGGVVPELACRTHLANIEHVVEESLRQAHCQANDLQLISVTKGPGLMGALLIGTVFAESYAYAINKPVIGVHHLEAHLCSGKLENPNLAFPFIGLLVSGGHTLLVLAEKLGKYKVLGQTRDDAAGEAFDKVASLLSLSYPGGPAIQTAAKKGHGDQVSLPRPMLNSGDLHFSFSGLKTAVLYKLKGYKDHIPINNIAASFQNAVVDVLVTKTLLAVQQYNVRRVVIGGGVAANQLLREAMQESCNNKNIELYLPAKKMCTDNAAMVASLGYFRYQAGLEENPNVDAIDHWDLSELC